MLVTFGTFRVQQDFLNLQNRRYFFAFFGHEAGLERETRATGRSLSVARVWASRSLCACLHLPEKREKLTPVRQARLPKSPFWLGHRCR